MGAVWVYDDVVTGEVVGDVLTGWLISFGTEEWQVWVPRRSIKLIKEFI